MNIESRRIADELVEVQAKHLSPVYEDLRDKLLGSLATSSMHLESLQAETAERRANMAFLGEVQKIFPQAEPFISERRLKRFAVADQFIAMAVQANTLWTFIPGKEGLMFTPIQPAQTPFFIIGRRSVEDGSKNSELLLLSAMPSDTPSLRVIKMSKKSAVAADEYSDRKIIEPFTQSEIDQLYDPDTGDLIVQVTNDRIMHDRTLGSRGFARFKVSGSIERPGLRMSHETSYDDSLRIGLTDYELARYNVIERLSKLAITFDVDDAFRQILSSEEESE